MTGDLLDCDDTTSSNANATVPRSFQVAITVSVPSDRAVNSHESWSLCSNEVVTCWPTAICLKPLGAGEDDGAVGAVGGPAPHAHARIARQSGTASCFNVSSPSPSQSGS